MLERKGPEKEGLVIEGGLNRGFTVYSFICNSWGAGTDAWGPDRDDVSKLP